MSLSSEQPEAHIDAAGTITALRRDEADRINSSVPFGPDAIGFVCAEGGWQVVVRNDLGSEIYLVLTDRRRHLWFRVPSGGRAALIASRYDPFPEGLSVGAYSRDGQLVATVRPTISQNVVYVEGAGGVSLRDMRDFWQGLTRDNLTRLNVPPSPAWRASSSAIG